METERKKYNIKPKLKAKWKIHEKPTGKFKSFESRAFPYLMYVSTGKIAASILCKTDYSLYTAKLGLHEPLRVCIYDYSSGAAARKTRYLKETFTKLEAAKEATIRFLKTHPEYWSKGEDE